MVTLTAKHELNDLQTRSSDFPNHGQFHRQTEAWTMVDGIPISSTVNDVYNDFRNDRSDDHNCSDQIIQPLVLCVGLRVVLSAVSTQTKCIFHPLLIKCPLDTLLNQVKCAIQSRHLTLLGLVLFFRPSESL